MRALIRGAAAVLLALLVACGSDDASVDSQASPAATEATAVAALEQIDSDLQTSIGDPPGTTLVHSDMATRCLEPSAGSEPGVIRVYDAGDPQATLAWYSETLPDQGWELVRQDSASITFTKSYEGVSGELFVDLTTDLGDVWVSGTVDFAFCPPLRGSTSTTTPATDPSTSDGSGSTSTTSS